MAELLKNKYNYQSIKELATNIKTAYREFNHDIFINDVLDDTWNNLELKARMRKITLTLGKHLPANYQQALNIIDKSLDNYPPGFNHFTLMYFPDFVEIYGQDANNWELSMRALAKYTQSSTSEFAVRPFLINHEKQMMEQMLIWAQDSNEHIRRLATEGCRPQLPWGQALISFKQNPLPVLKILEQLKADPSLYVRKSVANNLNDISKTHPELVIKIAQEWYGNNANTDWIVKHGCRTLLKKGNQEVMSIFGFNNSDAITINDFVLDTPFVSIGQDITFSFNLETKEKQKIRLEYGIDYVRTNGKRNRKVFQISETYLEKNIKKSYTKKHSFKEVRTRKHYLGTHSLTLIVNGKEWNTLNFDLIPAK